MFDVPQFRERLLESGALLRPACSVARIDAFEDQERLLLTPLLRQLYLAFDGLEVGDGDDLFRMWSLDEIAAERGYTLQMGNLVLRPIADIWIAADFLATSLNDPTAPVILHSTQAVVAANLEAFLFRYANGETRICR